MKISTLIEYLEDIPDKNWEIVLSKIFAIDAEMDNGKDPDFYEVILDSPIRGLMYNEDDKEVRFILDNGPAIRKYGEVIEFDPEAKTKTGEKEIH